MSNTTIFPTPLEQLRYLTQLFSLSFKGSKKSLDAKAHDKNVTWIYIESMIKKSLKEPLAKRLDNDIALLFERNFKVYIDHYRKDFVASESVTNLSREELMPILAKYYFPWIIYELITRYFSLDDANFRKFADLLNPDHRSLDFTLAQLDKHSSWKHYLLELSDTRIQERDDIDRDEIARWRRGEYLPKPEIIGRLNSNDESKVWNGIRLWLMVARALDELRRTEYAKYFFKPLYYLFKSESELQAESRVKALKESLFSTLDALQAQKNEAIAGYWEIFSQLDHIYLNLKNQKQANYKNEAAELLKAAYQITENKHFTSERKAGLTWLNARWCLFSDELAKAVEEYEKAFNDSLFCMGNGLENLILEALTAAAYLEETTKTSQRVFLARLKNAATFFGYELSAIKIPIEKLNHKDMIADWEVEMWANSFHVIFPIHSYFLGTKYPPVYAYRKRCIIEDEIKHIKPNYKNPNKTIGFAGKRMPQLVLFSFLHCNSEDNDKYLKILKKLLKEGANVNQLSSNGESAILFALEAMDLEAMPLASQDRRLFDLLIEYPHKPETINHTTTKREKFVLMQAVKTGRPDVVEKILKLGADANQLDLLKVSPLFQTLRLINKLGMGKDRLHAIYQQSIQKNKTDFNENENEYFRREHGATGGLSHSMFYSDLAHRWRAKANHPNSWQLLKEIINVISELEFKILEKYTSLEDLYNIVRLLLEAGADPNQSHTISTMTNYTPLMYAVEINDPIIFDLLKEKGGDISLKVTASYQDKLIDYTLSDIKKKWQSDKIKL